MSIYTIMIFDIYNQFGAMNSPPVFDAFKTGLLRLGHKVSNHQEGDVAVIWSVLWHGRMRANLDVWKYYKSKNKPIVVIEIGGLIRDHTWKIGINGINLGSYFYYPNQDNTRRKKLGIDLSPWNTNGKDILICGQHGNSEQWIGNPPVNDWVRNTIQELKKNTKRKIKVRAHPRFPIAMDLFQNGVERSLEKTLKEELINTWAVITHNSNPGMESILNGVPAFVHSSSLASPVANLDISNIETPLRPDRDQWLNDLCWTEWTTDEMATGTPQELLINHIQLSTMIGS